MGVLLKIESPTTGAHLKKFLGGLKWVRTSKLKVSGIIVLLNDFLKILFKRSGNLTTRAVSRFSVRSRM